MPFTFVDKKTGALTTTTLHNKVSTFVLVNGILRPKNLTVVYYWTTLDDCNNAEWTVDDNNAIGCPVADSSQQLYIQTEDVTYYDFEQLEWTFTRVNEYNPESEWTTMNSITNLPDGTEITDERHKEYYCSSSWGGWSLNYPGGWCDVEEGKGCHVIQMKCQVFWNWNGNDYANIARSNAGAVGESQGVNCPYVSACSPTMACSISSTICTPKQAGVTGETGGCGDVFEKTHETHNIISSCVGFNGGTCTKCVSTTTHSTCCTVCGYAPGPCQKCDGGWYTDTCSRCVGYDYYEVCKYDKETGAEISCVRKRYCADYQDYACQVCNWYGTHYAPECGCKTCGSHTTCAKTGSYSGESCGTQFMKAGDHWYYSEIEKETGTCPVDCSRRTDDSNEPGGSASCKEFTYAGTSKSCSDEADLGDQVSKPADDPMPN